MVRSIVNALSAVIIWVSYLGMLAWSMDRLDGWTIGLAFVLMMPAIAITGMILGAFTSSNSSENQATAKLSAEELEKRKRSRLDEVLRELSDEDLVRLRKRLSTGDISEDNLYEMMVGDDGELLYKNAR